MARVLKALVGAYVRADERVLIDLERAALRHLAKMVATNHRLELGEYSTSIERFSLRDNFATKDLGQSLASTLPKHMESFATQLATLRAELARDANERRDPNLEPLAVVRAHARCLAVKFVDMAYSDQIRWLLDLTNWSAGHDNEALLAQSRPAVAAAYERLLKRDTPPDGERLVVGGYKALGRSKSQAEGLFDATRKRKSRPHS